MYVKKKKKKKKWSQGRGIAQTLPRAAGVHTIL